MRTPLLCFLFSVFYTLGFSQGSGNALDLNGNSSYVNCGTMNLSGTSLTMMGWIKFDSFKSANPFISSMVGTETTGNTALVRFGDAGLAAQKAQFVLQIGSTQSKLNGVRSLTANEWYHVAATYDGSTMRIYINGQLDASKSQTGIITSNSTFNIGQNYSADRTLDGKIDEVAVFKAALSQATIRDYMCQSINPSHPNYAQLEAYFPLDEGTGSSTSDQSGNAHTGSLINTPNWQLSEAPIGDVSKNNFSSPFNLSLSHPDGDTLWLDSISGNPDAVFLYRVNGQPQAGSSFPASAAQTDTSRYWGVYFVGGNNPSAKLTYDFGANSVVGQINSCLFSFLQRDHNADLSWTNSSANQNGSTFFLQGTNGGEFLVGVGGSVNLTTGANTTICSGDSVQIQHASSGLNYTWLFNNAPIANANLNTLFAKQSGNYQLIYNYGSTCNDTTNVVSITVNPVPTVSYPSLPSVCADTPFVLLPLGTPAGGTLNSPYVSSQVFYTSLSGAGSFKISYAYTDANGCTGVASQFLEIKPSPNIQLNAIGPFCEGDSPINLPNATPSGGLFSIGGTPVSNFNPAIGIGTFQLKYSAVDTNGCSGVDSVPVTVNPNPLVTLNFSVGEVCERDDSLMLFGENPQGGSFSGVGVNGAWFGPNIGVGTYAVLYQYTDSLSGCGNTATDTINVNPNPSTPTISQNGDTLISTPALSFSWIDSTGQFIGVSDQKFTPDTNGKFAVVVFNEFGCGSDTSAFFPFEKPTNPGFVVAENAQHELQLFPNPTSGQLKVNSKFKVTSAQLIDQLGRSISLPVVQNMLNISQLTRGVYTVYFPEIGVIKKVVKK